MKKALILILAFALLARLYGITSESVWLDEAYSANMAVQPFLNILMLDDTNPPLHMLVMSVFVKLFGLSEFWMRLPFALIGTLAVYASYLLAGKIAGEKTAIISSLLLALSPYHVFYSQDARMYSLLTLFAGLSAYFFLKYYEKPEQKTLAFYIIASLLMVYTHLYGLFILAGINLFYLWKRRLQKNWVIAHMILIAAFLPWLPMFLRQFGLVNEEFWISRGELWSILWLPYRHAGGLIAGSVLYLLLIIGIRKSIGDKMQFLLAFMALPIAAAIVISLMATPVFFHKYAMHAVLAVYIFAGFAITLLKPKVKIAVIAVLVAVSVATLAIQAEVPQKSNWRDAAEYAKLLGGDVAINPEHQRVSYAYYALPQCLGEEMKKCLEENSVYSMEDYNNTEFVLIDAGNLAVENYTAVREFSAYNDLPIELMPFMEAENKIKVYEIQSR